MSSTVDFTPGGYAFIPGVFQYSAGVKALAGYRIERVRFASPVKLAEGFERIAATIRAAGRPLTSFAPASCARRRPSPRRASVPSTRSMSARSRNGACSWTGPILSRVERLPGGEAAGRAELPCLLLHRRGEGRAAVLRRRRQRRGAGRQRQLPRPHHCPRRRDARRLAAEGAFGCLAKWSVAWRRSAAAGGTSPRRSSTQCMTCILFSRRRSSAAALLAMASPGISTVRP